MAPPGNPGALSASERQDIMALKNMNSRESKQSMVSVLLAGAIALLALGVAYGAYSVIHQVNLTIFGQNVHGVFLAGFAVFIGMKYLFSVLKLRRKVSGLA